MQVAPTERERFTGFGGVGCLPQGLGLPAPFA